MYSNESNYYSYVPGADCPLYERLEYVENKTLSELANFAEDMGIESVLSMPQNIFTAGLRYCCKMIFRPPIDGSKDYFKIDLKDHQLVLALASVYINVCDINNKISTIQGLSIYLGVSSNYLYNLQKYNTSRYENTLSCGGNNNITSNSDENLSLSLQTDNEMNINFTSVNIIKEIKEAKERQLQGLLIDGKGNLIGVMAIMNHEFGYRTEGTQEAAPALTSTERQKALADKYRVSALPDKLSNN